MKLSKAIRNARAYKVCHPTTGQSYRSAPYFVRVWDARLKDGKGGHTNEYFNLERTDCGKLWKISQYERIVGQEPIEREGFKTKNEALRFIESTRD